MWTGRRQSIDAGRLGRADDDTAETSILRLARCSRGCELTIHELKCCHAYFAEVAADRKRFELRINDRPMGYETGDLLVLRETLDNEYTGRVEVRQVTYIMQMGGEAMAGPYANYVIMSIKPVIEIDRSGTLWYRGIDGAQI